MGNVPKLRFPEFSGEWEKKKLKDVGNSVIGLTYSPNDISDKGYLVLRACNIKDNQLSFNDQVFVNMRIPEKLTVRKGDILICARSGSQHLIGKNAYIEKDYPNYTFGAFMCVFRCDESAFVFQGFQTARIKRQIFENQGARINQITTANINAFSMYFPGIKEQTKIANFLTLFDKKIEKQSEKVAALEEYKKGLMQKIFTREIRFKDDEGKDYPEWTNKLYGDIFCFHPTYSYSRAMLNNVGSIKYIHYGDVHTKYPIVLDVKNTQIPYLNSKSLSNDIDSYSYCKEGDLIIADASEDYDAIGKATALTNIGNDKIISGLHTILARDEQKHTEPSFRGYLLASEEVKKQIRTSAAGAKVLGISKSNLAKIKISLPTLPEQAKIASFLTLFDRKIEKEKAKLEALREQKKGLLQQMFV